MKYKKIVRLYSNSRVAKYYRATSGDKNKAVMLYFANMKIAQAFHPLLSSFEVILRNQLHYALAHHFSDGNWIINQKNGFMVASSLTHTNKRTKKQVTNRYLLTEVQKAEKKISQGSTVFYNPYNQRRSRHENERRTPRVGLSHELQHSFDLDKKIATDETTENGIKLMDVRAINTENKIRSKTGDPKRTTYGTKKVPKELLE